MSLTLGTRIGNFEIVEPLGAGGMGEVYRARDTRLDRSVAIKSLPQAFATDAERLGRFEREAKLLASLNHPNIAGIYGLEDADGGPVLVLEFIEGETLAQRLARGPLGVRETLDIGGQIASAIEAAHERGIVHRDLKPGNVMLTASRAVKVLDFGLAKGTAAESSSSLGVSSALTMPRTATVDGVILGTAPYMSPEQARGKEVDRRTDVWAFGCLLYECLTGHPAFAGETMSDIIARILEREPEWSAIPASVPGKLGEVVKRCLTKDAAARPRDIGDLRRELSTIASELSSGQAASAAASPLPSLAVLYFENLTNDSESDYFCAGITEDILTDLSKIKGLRVASRNAVLRYRGAPADIPRVATDLGVSAVLEGSVRRSGSRVRITAQLINAADGFHLWAERYDRTLQDVFDVQEEIASSITEALRVTLTPVESRNLVQGRPKDVQAYDLYLKGREKYGSYTAESFREALELFQQAIAIDPGYALAYAGVADCYGQMMQWGLATDLQETGRLGLEAARRAIELNPRLAEGYKAESLVLRNLGQIENSHASLIKALEANPRFVPALINLAVREFAEANVAGTERLVRRALEVDPQEAFAMTWLSFVVRLTNRDDEAFGVAARLRQVSSDPFYKTISHVLRVGCYIDRGDLAAAERQLREGLADGAHAGNLRTYEALMAARAGRIEEARRLLHELESIKELGAGPIAALAGTALRVGEPERAVRLMSRPLVGDLAASYIRLEPELHPLLDREPYAPRRSNLTLVWPLEGSMIDSVRYGLFREVRIESGLPQGSEVG